MEKIKILGDHALRLQGKVGISGSKNAVLPAIVASLLTEERLRLRNVPRVKDVFTTLTLMEELGAESELTDDTLPSAP
jgi:UDP-N-acetylglucosamine 1-carboxyvinyltransferase